MKRFFVAWLIMWGLTYIVSGILSPQITGDNVIVSTVIYVLIGTWITLTAIVRLSANSTQYPYIISICRVSLCTIAIVEVVGGVLSWTGQAVWNVPYENALAQVSMAFADLLAAAVAIHLAISSD